MKITIFLALTLAALYVALAQPLSKEEAQGHPLEQEQDEGNIFLEPSQQHRLKRANCDVGQCNRICATRGKMGLCRKGICKCY